jgi:MATE family multidrug resistance protein
MVMASVAYWCIGLPASYVLGFTFGLEGVGVWAGLSVGLAVAAVLLSHRFWRGTVVNPTERSEASP